MITVTGRKSDKFNKSKFDWSTHRGHTSIFLYGCFDVILTHGHCVSLETEVESIQVAETFGQVSQFSTPLKVPEVMCLAYGKPSPHHAIKKTTKNVSTFPLGEPACNRSLTEAYGHYPSHHIKRKLNMMAFDVDDCSGCLIWNSLLIIRNGLCSQCFFSLCMLQWTDVTGEGPAFTRVMGPLCWPATARAPSVLTSCHNTWTNQSRLKLNECTQNVKNRNSSFISPYFHQTFLFG